MNKIILNRMKTYLKNLTIIDALTIVLFSQVIIILIMTII